MDGLPVFVQQVKFTTPGYANAFLVDGSTALHRIPTIWALQVTGLNAAGANVAAGAWSVSAQASLDGIGYDGDTTTALLSHVSGTNADGAVVKSNSSFMAARYVRLHCTSLTLTNAAAIYVSLLGV